MNYHELGEELLQQERWQEAVDAYRQAIENHPNFPLSYQKLGQALAELKQWEKAVDAYQKAIEINPYFSWSYHKLGEALTELKQWKKAVDAYQKAIEINPHLSWTYHNLGDLLSKLSRWKEAVDAYQNAININPTSYASYNSLWEALMRIKNWDKAARRYRQYLKINPKSYWSYYQLGYVLKQIGLIDEAIAYYLKALKLKVNLPWFHADLGDALLEKGESEEAIASYIKAIELQADFVPAYDKLRKIHSLNVVKLTKIQLDDLVKSYGKAITTKPNFTEHYVNLGNIFSGTDRIEEATACYRNAIKNQTRLSHPELSDRSSEQLSNPNFIIIGTIKGGTSSLYNYICMHPQVLPAIEKEVHFFDTHFNKGIKWYLAHFPAISTDKNFLTGEASPNYFYCEEAAARLGDIFPKTKLIVMLRNPIDRAVSHYYMAKRLGKEERSLEEVIAKEMVWLKKIENNSKDNAKLSEDTDGYFSFSLYLNFLKRWLNLFPREQILILKSEDMYHGPEAAMKQVFEFLELPDYQIHQYRKYCADSYYPIKEPTRQTLSKLFLPHNERLEKYLGRKFNW